MEKKYAIKGVLTVAPVDIDKKTELDMDMLRELLKNVPVDAEIVSIGLNPDDGLTLEYRQVVDLAKQDLLSVTRDYHSAPIDQLNSSPINWAERSMIETINSTRAEASESM